MDHCITHFVVRNSFKLFLLLVVGLFWNGLKPFPTFYSNPSSEKSGKSDWLMNEIKFSFYRSYYSSLFHLNFAILIDKIVGFCNYSEVIPIINKIIVIKALIIILIILYFLVRIFRPAKRNID